jgi:hypothetical protein
MLEKRPRRARKPATHDNVADVVERALLLIKPKPEQAEDAREQVVNAIAAVRSVNGWYENLTAPQKRELRALRKGVRGLGEVIAALEPHVPPDHDPDPWRLDVEHPFFDEPFVEYCLDEARELRQVLADIADSAERKWRGTGISIGNKIGTPRKPRANPKKMAAAWRAHELLLAYGLKPTLSVESAFIQLAAALYEGGTGSPGTTLERACRTVLETIRTTARSVRGDY